MIAEYPHRRTRNSGGFVGHELLRLPWRRHRARHDADRVAQTACVAAGRTVTDACPSHFPGPGLVWADFVVIGAECEQFAQDVHGKSLPVAASVDEQVVQIAT